MAMYSFAVKQTYRKSSRTFEWSFEKTSMARNSTMYLRLTYIAMAAS